MLIISQLIAQTAYALNSKFQNYSLAQGLSQNTIPDIVEDKRGFMWFATLTGLNRFDGYEFKVYKHDPDIENSLPDSFIRELLVDSSGNLWVGTLSGLARYNEKSDNFETYNKTNSVLQHNEILALALDANDRLLVTDEKNLYFYEPETNSFSIRQTLGLPLPPAITFIFGEKDKTWIGSFGHGLFLLDNETNYLYDLKEKNPWGLSLKATILNDIIKIDNTYWLATNQGVYKFQSDSLTSTLYDTKTKIAISGDDVKSLSQDHLGRLWFATTTGLSVLDPQNGNIFSYNDKNNVNFGIENIFFLKVYKDSKDTLWFGSYSGGIYKHTPQTLHIDFFQKNTNSNSLSGNNIWGIAQDDNDKIWLATQSNGLSEFDPENYSFKHHLKDFKHNIWNLLVDDLNQIWVASSGGLFVYKKDDKGQLRLVVALSQGNHIEYIHNIAGRIWIKSSTNKIESINPRTFEFDSIPLTNSNIKEVNPVFLDSRNNLWLVTTLGIMLYNLDTKQVNQLIFNFNDNVSYFSSIAETEDAFWLSSLTHGILILDKNSYKVIKQIDTTNGLSGNQITKSFVVGKSLWVGTTVAGINEVSLDKREVIQTISPKRLDYNELNEGAALLSRNNKLYFGGTNGFLLFDPKERSLTVEQLNKKQLNPDIAPVIIQLKIASEEVSLYTPLSPLTESIESVERIKLPANEYILSFKFAQLNPVEPEDIQYRYRLLGYSDKWAETDIDSPRRAPFNLLEYGDYEFQVQSRIGGSPWSSIRSVKIEMSPPIHKSQKAMILYSVLLTLILIYWIKQTRAKRAIQQSIQENEERLKLTLWSSGDELWDWDIYQGQVFRSNTWGTLDFPQDDIRVNSAYEANIHPNDIVKVQETLREHLKDKSEHYEVTYRARTYKGEWVWLLDRGKVVSRDNNNQAQRMTGTLKNISHLKLAEEQLKLFKRSIETISDGVFITDSAFKFISVNNSYCKYTGETKEQALVSYLTFHQYPGAFTEEVKKAIRQKGNWFGEVESRRTDGEKYEMELNIDAINDEDGKPSHYVGVFSDITTRKTTEKELLKLANTDPLTDLPNRSFFQASHNNIVRRDTHHALICLDMDNFKKINDSLGHQTGDVLIKQIAKRLQRISGTEATCYRLGGDEFSILIDKSTDVHRITHFAQTILDDMARPFLINKQEFVLGASLGIAFYPEDGSTPQELLKNADTAMYFAKNAGGNKYQFFSGEMNQNAVRQLQIENLIRHGLKEDLFTVFYQPKVDIASGKLVSMEALVRYEHPDKGLVSPSQFIPLAEETGQIIDIGEVVLRKACEETKRWVDAGLFTGRVAVNISARQFELPDLDERIISILQRAGLSPLHLECEITEGTLMQNPESALRMMQRLRERGIHLALDDFGTGYSSLAYLKRFPINTLKIDKAFIDDIATSSEDRHMAQAIITIAHNLGLKVVAEGVEHENQLSILRRFKCEMLQGYLYSKPLSSTRFERLLKENHELNKMIHKSDS
ncbi:EAL domain-containing protein [Paraglaciecola sp. 25GB23A]|uniref:EAL domain-containing protein n=1 Tax=Paraglaciecola sp. 25GB23A TaxID=3156068 RepID=UPI0032AFF885